MRILHGTPLSRRIDPRSSNKQSIAHRYKRR